MNLILSANIFSGFFLTGLIWVIQFVHYPAFRFVAKEDFIKFSSFHQMRIFFITAPMMLLELFTSIALCLSSVSDDLLKVFYLNLLFVLIIWFSTFFLQVPCHFHLKRGKNFTQIKKLVLSNWIRTFFWSIRAVLLLYLLRNNIQEFLLTPW